MSRFRQIDSSAFDERVLRCQITVLCDVDNLLLGEQGSAAVFGPQKGASPADVKLLNLHCPICLILHLSPRESK